MGVARIADRREQVIGEFRRRQAIVSETSECHFVLIIRRRSRQQRPRGNSSRNVVTYCILVTSVDCQDDRSGPEKRFRETKPNDPRANVTPSRSPPSRSATTCSLGDGKRPGACRVSGRFPMSRQTFTERRRHQLARRVAALEAMEPRNMITESLGIISMGIGVPVAAAAFGAKDARRSTAPAAKPVSHPLNIRASSVTHHGKSVGGGSSNRALAVATSHRAASTTGNWLTLFHRGTATKAGADHQPFTLSKPAAKSSDGGGASRGGSGSTSSGLVIPFRLPPPTPVDAGSSSAVASASMGALGSAFASTAQPTATASHPASAPTGGQGASVGTSANGMAPAATPAISRIGRTDLANSSPNLVNGNSSGAARAAFSHFPL